VYLSIAMTRNENWTKRVEIKLKRCVNQ